MTDFIGLIIMALLLIAGGLYLLLTDNTSGIEEVERGYVWALYEIGRDQGTLSVRAFLRTADVRSSFNAGVREAINEYEENLRNRMGESPFDP